MQRQTLSTYFLLGLSHFEATIIRAIATIKKWFSQKLRVIIEYHIEPLTSEGYEKNVDAAAGIEKKNKYCLESSFFFIKQSGSKIKLKLQT